MLTKPQIQTAIPERQANIQRTVKPALLGVRGRLILLAIVPVVLVGLGLYGNVQANVGEMVGGLYERQTNKVVQTLMGNIDFTKPKEIEREFKQAMDSSDILGFYLTQVDAGGQQRSQLVFKDEQARTEFETFEPKYVTSKNNGVEAEREFFANYTYEQASLELYVLRGSGLGGRSPDGCWYRTSAGDSPECGSDR